MLTLVPVRSSVLGKRIAPASSIFVHSSPERLLYLLEHSSSVREPEYQLSPMTLKYNSFMLLKSIPSGNTHSSGNKTKPLGMKEHNSAALGRLNKR